MQPADHLTAEINSSTKLGKIQTKTKIFKVLSERSSRARSDADLVINGSDQAESLGKVCSMIRGGII